MMRRLLIALGILLLIAVVWWGWRGTQPDVSPDKIRELAGLRVTGLGLLENDQPGPSLPAFVELTEAFPDQPLGHRNLAVGRLMVLQSLDRSGESERWQDALRDAQQAVTQLQQVDPDSAATYILAARVAAKAEDLDAAVAHYETALEKAPPPEQAAIWFEWYQTAQFSESETAQAAGRKALAQAYQAAPRNSAALLEWLMVQADNEDPTIAATLTQARDVLAPLDPTIQQRVRVSLLELLDNASTAATDGDWQQVRRWVRMVMNVTRPEELVRSDLSRLDRNVLEFVLVDFPDSFYEANGLERLQPTPPIPVRFVAAPLPIPADVQDFAIVDFDLDGLLDLVTLRETAVEVWSRATLEDAWQLQLSQPLEVPARGLVLADLDADAAISSGAESSNQHTADFDVIVYGANGWQLLENREDAQGNRQLVPQPLEQPVTAETHTIAAGDFDLDGDLDLFVASAEGVNIWTNRGSFSFTPWDPAALIESDGLRPQAALVVDWDRDIDLDILLPAHGDQPAGYLENLRHSRLRWHPFPAEFGLPEAAETLTLEDLDGNASWDLLATAADGGRMVTTRTPTAGRVVPRESQPFPAPLHRIVTRFDYDNDGVVDLLVQPAADPSGTLQLWRHHGDGRYTPQPDSLPASVPGDATAEAADLDQDGDLDLVLLAGGQLQLLDNEGGNANHWVDVVLLAQQVKGADTQASGRVNQYGYGSLLELKQGTTYQPRVVASPSTHFGLGQQEQADVVRIVWTNGVPQNVIAPAGDQTITERQTLKGSCPYLYGWSGEGYAFITDLLWAAPLGLQTPAGTIAPDRPWEYLKIAGEALTPIDGEYRLQVTEELWEAAYFDHISLIAVDHPASVEIFTNEKVGPPAIAEPKLHQVPQRRRPVRATDAQGRDVLATIAAEDDRYLKGYTEKYCQGYVSPHYLELDLGKLDAPEKLTLFLTGWIYPTDTSLNVQLAQDPSRPGPRPPSLLVPDADGSWREAIDFIGFPGGKTKTIAVDLSDVTFPSGDYRLRIATSAEIYWDGVFFTVDPPPQEVREQPLRLLAADLHPRGVSARVPHPGFGPERYDYQRVSTVPAWPPMKGAFTRFGDVRELVQAVDDQLVVMGTGDELTLRFAVPETPLPEGWRRDFVLHNWGWDKDADLNTLYGETSEPLPFQDMQAYPAPADQPRPATAAYRDYLQRYQQRRQGDGAFRRWVRDFSPAPPATP